MVEGKVLLVVVCESLAGIVLFVAKVGPRIVHTLGLSFTAIYTL